MKKFIYWCKIIFTQKDGAVRLSPIRERLARRVNSSVEIVSSELFSSTALVRLEENTIYLNRTESSFIHKQVRRLLKTQRQEMKRRKKAGIPEPPEPGKISYAVYQ